jgi:subtilisin family serine protease
MSYLIQNNAKFDYCNIPYWHSKGYTGKNVKIGIISDDYNSTWPVFEGKAQSSEYLKTGFNNNDIHGFSVAHVIHQVTPDAEFYSIPRIYPPNPLGYFDYIKWAYDNGVRIISMSAGGSDDVEYFYNANKWAYEHGMTLVCSAGNRGTSKDNTLNVSAQTEHWISIGAVDLISGKPQRLSYSSVGEQLDVCGFTNLYVGTNPESPLTFTGTSCACPFIAGMLALWFQYFYEKYNEYPTPQESLMFLVSNCEDLQEVGKDNYTGNGLARLPKEIYEMEIKLKIDSLEYTINGTRHYMDVSPKLINGRTMVPVRFISEALGYNIEWDGINKIVTIVK